MGWYSTLRKGKFTKQDERERRRDNKKRVKGFIEKRIKY
jgi:hypothetical protein